MNEWSRREAWERHLQWPLMGAALIFLVGCAWSILDAQISATCQDRHVIDQLTSRFHHPWAGGGVPVT